MWKSILLLHNKIVPEFRVKTKLLDSNPILQSSCLTFGVILNRFTKIIIVTYYSNRGIIEQYFFFGMCYWTLLQINIYHTNYTGSVPKLYYHQRANIYSRANESKIVVELRVFSGKYYQHLFMKTKRLFQGCERTLLCPIDFFSKKSSIS